nr:hypothetical protein [Bacteroides intestinalis]
MRYKFHYPGIFGIQVIKEVAFLADESEKISDSRKRCYPIRESESDSSNYKNMGTSKKVYVW